MVLDGLVARMHHKQSDFGDYLGLLMDFMIYVGVPIAFIVVMPTMVKLWSGLALGALLEKRQQLSSNRLTSIEMPTGLIEGAETILFYSAFYLWPDDHSRALYSRTTRLVGLLPFAS